MSYVEEFINYHCYSIWSEEGGEGDANLIFSVFLCFSLSLSLSFSLSLSLSLSLKGGEGSGGSVPPTLLFNFSDFFFLSEGILCLHNKMVVSCNSVRSRSSVRSLIPLSSSFLLFFHFLSFLYYLSLKHMAEKVTIY